ncbi:MAG: hypothetical protein CMN31_00170 [Sandaracinus sp.]|nr:hypothetical protein [Sandaracinus sp.]
MTAARTTRRKLTEALPKKLLDKRDIAKLLGLSTETVRRMVARGDLPAKKVAGRLRFDPREIQAWLEVELAMTDSVWRARLLEQTRKATRMLVQGTALDRAASGNTRALEATLERWCP